MTGTEDTKRIVERLPVTTLSDGQQIELTIHKLRGAKEGPRLALFAGIHGDEPLGCEILRRLLLAIDPGDLTGEVLAVPVANPLAYHALTRVTPLDGMNLNRIFPGDRNGSVTEQIAAVLADLLEEGVTHLIDFHSGGNFACVDYSYLHDNGAEMSRAFGCRVLYHGQSYVGSSTDFALSKGISAMVSELGGGSRRIEEFIERGTSGALNVMRTLGMLAGEPSPPDAEQVVVDIVTVLRPKVGGVLLSHYGADKLGVSVPAGTVLGTIVSPYTFEELSRLVAPYEPSILVLGREPVTTVHPGDYGFMVADGATARPAN